MYEGVVTYSAPFGVGRIEGRLGLKSPGSHGRRRRRASHCVNISVQLATGARSEFPGID